MANIRTQYKQKYGLDWPTNSHDIMIDLICGRNWRFSEYACGQLLNPEEHLLRAARALFTSEELTISTWTEQHFRDWARETFCITLGGASCSKSNDYGCLAVLDWVTSPTTTYTVLASTSRDMLRVRSYEAVQRYFSLLKKNPYFLIPGKESKSQTFISCEDISGDMEGLNTTSKASIRGVAVQQGTLEEARTALQGAHLPAVRLILDELSQMREAAIAARTNLSIGTLDFRLFGLANPDSVSDLACRYSVPTAGWGSVTVDTDRWETNFGSVRHHNGFKSPAITEPDGERKYPYLINQKQIDAILKEHNGNMDAPAIWSMIYGMPAPAGRANTIISEGSLTTFHAQDVPVWNSGFTVVAGLDPAFSADGDDAVFVIGRVGHVVDGRLTIGLGEMFKLKLEASNVRPFSYQILDQVLDLQKQYGFEWSNLAIDDSGTQSIADIVEASTGHKVHRVNFGGKASDLPISIANRNPASDVYANRITELYYAFAEYLQCNQIRGLSPDAANEFCARRLVEGKRPKRLETKVDLKKRIKRSPDHADAVACLIGVVRERMGILPGATALVPEGVPRPQSVAFTNELLQMYDLDGRSGNYCTPLK